MGTSKKIAAGMLLTVALGSGCSDDAGENLAERVIEEQTGGDVDINSDDGEVTFENEDGSMTFGDELPDDFPSDIYLPDGQVTASGTSDGQTFVTFEAEGDFDDVAEEAQSAMEESFELSDETSFDQDDFKTQSFSFENEDITGTYAINEAGGSLTISIQFEPVS